MLILGSSGPIGRAIATQAKAWGIHVVGVSRSHQVSGLVEEKHLCFDSANADDVLSGVREEAIDIVVDVIAYTEQRTKPLLRALDGQIQRYVLVSSCDVYRNYSLLHRREKGAVESEIDENGYLRTSLYPYRASAPRAPDDPLSWHDSYDKIPIENDVRALRSDWTIARLPMVFGPNDHFARFGWAIKPMLANEQQVEIPTAWLDWTTTYGFLDNMGAALCCVATHPAAANTILNIADFPTVTHREWLSRFQQMMGWKGTLVETADAASPISRATSRLDLSVPLRIKATRLLDGLGFQPPVSLNAALYATIGSDIA